MNTCDGQTGLVQPNSHPWKKTRGASFKKGSMPVKTNLHQGLSHKTRTAANSNSSFPLFCYWKEEISSRGWTFPAQRIQYVGLLYACFPSLLVSPTCACSFWRLVYNSLHGFFCFFWCSSSNVTQNCKNILSKDSNTENLWLVQPMCKTTLWIQNRQYLISLCR